MNRRRWKDYGQDWPEGFRLCCKCKEILPYEQFHKHSGCLTGYNSVCKACRIPVSKKNYKRMTRTYRMFNAAKSRANKKGLEFTIKESDIQIPEICPVFNVPMVGKYSPSLDRIDPSKGYTPDNVQVISSRANTLKNNASVEEIKELLNWMLEKREIG